MRARLLIWAYCATVGAAAVIWAPGWWRLLAIPPALSTWAVWRITEIPPPAAPGGPLRAEQPPAGTGVTPQSAQGPSGGTYPAPHYDEYNTCRCPDHVAQRWARLEDEQRGLYGMDDYQ